MDLKLSFSDGINEHSLENAENDLIINGDRAQFRTFFLNILQLLRSTLAEKQSICGQLQSDSDKLATKLRWKTVGEIASDSQEDLESRVALSCTRIREFLADLCPIAAFCEKLLRILTKERDSLPLADNLELATVQDFISQLNKITAAFAGRLIIVHQQPAAVLKQNDPIITELRIHYALSSMDAFHPRLRIITAEDGDRLRLGQIKATEIQSAATVSSERGTLKLERGAIRGVFAKTKLETISFAQRNSSRGADQMYVILYQIERNENVESLTDEELSAAEEHESFWALSCPFALLSQHASDLQCTKANASVLWNRAFDNAREVKWTEFARFLRAIFRNLSGATQRSLSNDDLMSLKSKLASETDDWAISYDQFAKNKIGQNFTFFTWFYEVTLLIRRHLLPYWEKDYLMGFMSKETLSGKMSAMEEDCFALRFSDSQLGTLSLSIFEYDINGTMDHSPYLLMSDPLTMRHLIDVLRNFESLKGINAFCDSNFQVLKKSHIFGDHTLEVSLSKSDLLTKVPPGYKAAVNVESDSMILCCKLYLIPVNTFGRANSNIDQPSSATSAALANDGRKKRKGEFCSLNDLFHAQ